MGREIERAVEFDGWTFEYEDDRFKILQSGELRLAISFDKVDLYLLSTGVTVQGVDGDGYIYMRRNALTDEPEMVFKHGGGPLNVIKNFDAASLAGLLS